MYTEMQTKQILSELSIAAFKMRMETEEAVRAYNHTIAEAQSNKTQLYYKAK